MMRIGHGFDIHRLEEGRQLFIGGVEVAYTRGLAGHSDGDVLLHAVADALLGAAGEPDLGALFPDTDPTFKGIASVILLTQAVSRVEAKGFRIVNIDSTIAAQAPRLSPFLAAMGRTIAQAAGIESQRVNVKVKSAEGLGAIGRGEGIAAWVVCLLEEQPLVNPDKIAS